MGRDCRFREDDVESVWLPAPHPAAQQKLPTEFRKTIKILMDQAVSRLKYYIWNKIYLRFGSRLF